MTASDGHPAEDFLKPRLQALISEGVKAGFTRDVIVAVLFELLDGSAGENTEKP